MAIIENSSSTSSTNKGVYDAHHGGGGDDDLMISISDFQEKLVVNPSTSSSSPKQEQEEEIQPPHRRVLQTYTKEFLLTNLKMGNEFIGPLMLQPKRKFGKCHEKVMNEHPEESKKLERTMDRIQQLVRQNQKPYFTLQELQTIYWNVYGESITLPPSGFKTIRGIICKVPNVRVVFYPNENITKIFWKGN